MGQFLVQPTLRSFPARHRVTVGARGRSEYGGAGSGRSDGARRVATPETGQTPRYCSYGQPSPDRPWCAIPAPAASGHQSAAGRCGASDRMFRRIPGRNMRGFAVRTVQGRRSI